MSKIIFTSPSKYMQGEGVIEELGQEVAKISDKAMLIADENVWGITEEDVTDSFSNSDAEFHFEEFNGEASTEEIERLAETAKENNAGVIIGVGGGKTLDSAKGIADEIGVPVVVVPTTASTDAPTSALSVIYSEDGVFEGYRFYDKNPDLVLVDTGIVVNAPANFFAAGISDAMATLVEAKASVQGNGDTMAGGKASLAGQAIAQKAEETLFQYGLAAYKAVQEGLVTSHVEKVVEANTLLSGLGFENAGLAGAHAIHNGFTALDGDIHDLSHGEKVAYGTLTQLVLQGHPEEEIKKYIDFFKEIDMPTTLEDMHLENTSYEDLLKVGELATAEGETMENMPMTITPSQVVNAILAVNELN